MARPKKFKIEEFKTKAAETRYRATGTVGGVQFRKKFTVYDEAVAYLTHQKLKDASSSSKSQLRLTPLTDEELNDAYAALKLLRDEHPKRDLSWAVRFTLEHFKHETNPVTFGDFSPAFLAEIKEHVSEQVYNDYRRLLEHLGERFKGRKLNTISTEDLNNFIASRSQEKLKKKTRNNYRVNLRRIFTWASADARRYCVRPTAADGLIRFKIGRETPDILTVEDAEKVMRHAETFMGGKLVNVIALCLFAGVRPTASSGEIFKLGQDIDKPKYFDLDKGLIELSSSMSKTRYGRQIEMQPNLIAWFKAYPLSEYPILEPGLTPRQQASRLSYRLSKFRKTCPVNILHNALRHTFATYRAQIATSFVAYLEEAGHSEKIARMHYLRRSNPEEAARFWNILPNGPQSDQSEATAA